MLKNVTVGTGAEAGGRGSVNSPPTLEFVKQTIAAIQDGPPILAAGGVMKGSQVASLLDAGASGVVLGTRVLFTPECMFSEEMKQVLIAAGPNSTSRSPAYDLLFPPGVWPGDIQARCVENKILKEYKAGLDPAERKVKISNGDVEHLVVYAGTGVSEVNEIEPTEVSSKLTRFVCSAP